MTTADLDQAHAATAEMRTLVAAALGIDSEPTEGTSQLFEEFWATYSTASRCPHLSARPIQPSLLILPFPAWHCRPCAAAAGAQLRGAAGLGHLEEWTCDRCRRYTPSSLTPILVRQDLWLVVGSLCARCTRDAVRQGAALKGDAT